MDWSDEVKCPLCQGEMNKKHYNNSRGFYFQCYNCKITTEIILSIAELLR